VDIQSYDNLITLLGGEGNEEKEINKYTDCIDMLIGITNKNVLKIIQIIRGMDTKKVYRKLMVLKQHI